MNDDREENTTDPGPQGRARQRCGPPGQALAAALPCSGGQTAGGTGGSGLVQMRVRSRGRFAPRPPRRPDRPTPPPGVRGLPIMLLTFFL